MEQKPAHELNGIQSHDLAPAVVRVVFPLKTDAAVFESTKAVVGDGYAVGVASQVFQHALRSAEGRLGVNHPIDFGGFFTQGGEGGGGSQASEFTVEAQGAAAEGLA